MCAFRSHAALLLSQAHNRALPVSAVLSPRAKPIGTTHTGSLSTREAYWDDTHWEHQRLASPTCFCRCSTCSSAGQSGPSWCSCILCTLPNTSTVTSPASSTPFPITRPLLPTMEGVEAQCVTLQGVESRSVNREDSIISSLLSFRCDMRLSYS